MCIGYKSWEELLNETSNRGVLGIIFTNQKIKRTEELGNDSFYSCGSVVKMNLARTSMLM